EEILVGSCERHDDFSHQSPARPDLLALGSLSETFQTWPLALEGLIDTARIDRLVGSSIDAAYEPPHVLLLEDCALELRQRPRDVLDADAHQERGDPGRVDRPRHRARLEDDPGLAQVLR